MSHQPYQQQPAWGAPPAPRPPKKKGPKIAAIGCGRLLALFIGLAVLGAAIGDSDDKDEADDKPSATSSAPALTDEQRASIDAAAGLPPKPDAATRKAYLDALDAIDPRIAKDGKDDQTVDRGRNQCSSIKSNPDDKDKLSQLALDRFTITTRLPDIATPQTGAKVTDAVHKHLCPDF
ncbi:hypothetical protein [Streptomyces sp. S.PB5]|uniref:hypothetical protein n=1 Tax=Streptomyces sp. S.PB5 TaxID=3020844 RepID=UPI0025B1C43B|nr:hypothetical protein [Streptomyces sp. S.PB5]MDN3021553.1 hypothetical protein [Streptomyces sp. S.PB5]